MSSPRDQLDRKIADYELMIRERQRFADSLDDLGETLRLEIIELAHKKKELEDRR